MWKIKNASRAKKLNTSQYLSRLNVRRIIILLLTLVIINMKSCSIIRKFVSFWSYINNCDRHFSWKMWSKPLKKHSNRKKAVLNLCGVMIYNIVYGPLLLLLETALWSATISENIEKRFDYNICEAGNDNLVLSEIDMW